MQRIRLVSCLIAITLCAFAGYTKLARAEVDPTPLLEQALRFRVTIYTNPRTGFMLPAYHCRRATGGCDRQLYEFAHYLTEAGERNGIDPWLLAAMAFRESGLNPFAVGAVGELGILQLHPRNPRTKGVRFVHDQWYRQRCKHEPGACQREVVDRAAELLAYSVEKCGGNVDQALSAYNSGRCTGNLAYAKRVRGELQKMRLAVGLPVGDNELASAAHPAGAVHTSLVR